LGFRVEGLGFRVLGLEFRVLVLKVKTGPRQCKRLNRIGQGTGKWSEGVSGILDVKPSLRVTVTLKNFGQRPINGASFLVDRTRSKQVFHTSQNMPYFCAFYWVTTVSSAKRVSGWPKGRNFGGVTGEPRRLGLKQAFRFARLRF